MLTKKTNDSKLYNWYIKVYLRFNAHVAQPVERRLGKAEVVGSIPIVSSKIKKEKTLGKVYYNFKGGIFNGKREI